MSIRVAYLISVYKDPVHLKRLISALSYGVEENVKFFIHVDAKVEEKPFREMCSNANVSFCPNRYWVQWGGQFSGSLPKGIDTMCIRGGKGAKVLFSLCNYDRSGLSSSI